MNNYFELNISINPEMEEIVSDIFFTNFDCEGVILEEEAYKDLEMTSTTRGKLRVFLTTYPQNLSEILSTERELMKSRGLTDEDLGSWEITLDEKENQDWSKKWKEKWTVTHVTDKIAIVPSWLNYTPKKDEITITLDPGCAFGTGTHQTTQLCMKALEKYLKKGDSVADIGTGSGILAILAKKLGAGKIYGCDNDESVIDVCKENALKNGIYANIDQFSPPLEGGGRGWGKNALHKFSKNAQINAKELRNNTTKQEKTLWKYLNKSQLGYKFRRQQPIGNYIVDFFCPSLNLIIELDGGQHNEPTSIEYDNKRTNFLNKLRYRVLRIWNNDIDTNIEGVVEYIKLNLTPPPNPLPQGAGKTDHNCEFYLPPQGAGEVTFELNTADKITEKFDFVCANILHFVLAEIMGDLKNITKPNGLISLSGILDEKKDMVLEAIQRENLKIIDTITQDQWISFVVQKA